MVHSIVEAVFQHAQEQPERQAILFEDQAISYGQLYADVARFAQALTAWGVQAGDRVALFLENCPTFVVAYLGTHLAGGVVVLVNPQYRQVELSHIMNDAGVRLCVTSTAGAAELQSLTIPDLSALVIVDAADQVPSGGGMEQIAFAAFIQPQPQQAGEEGQLALPAADAPALIGYTSGTTGRSKGALLLHRNLVANIAAVTSAWHWTEHDRLLLTLPLFHAHGLMVGMHGTLFKGSTVVLRRKFDAADCLTILKNDPEITLFFGVPTMYARLLAEAKRQGVPSHLPRLFVSGSAPLSPQLFEDFARTFGQTMLERYGMTETIMNLTNPYEGERRAGTVGGPFPGQEARVVDVRTREQLPAGEIGEIEIRGPHVFAGYWNQPDATAEAFAPDGWFKTGDLGWCSDDGYYTITGRARELIISGGYNVYPREVEDVLEMHPDVAEAAVIGLPDIDLGEQVVAVIVPVRDHTPDPAALIAFCRERLASYKKPRQIIFVSALPRNALGKIQKPLLVERLKSI
ncbi:long-chain-fatty-acid--CoA ligase [Reticulibacter mediterranei]|uniref:Long-chain-fatty-acid--CoA ligase n=1 Tax=Reticulibacter mediterranei TaxID=2778369 RepID=A0A8J3ISH1_9CHLR|nr:acyl-CoA synthetase [Reticulibacter mediterranei]GHO97069.1 long-chain-fatty-acid--CoA ligase [Reticulibacter mediterranei]